MKYLRSFLLFLSAAFIISSCQKELSFEEGTARGTLKKASGDCNPMSITGTFKKDTLLTAGNYVDIQVDITQTGTYSIKTDTLNGYSFSATGVVAIEGLNTIRLLASGRPVAASLDVFTVKFDSTSCQINIVVTGNGGGGGAVAKFTLVGSPSTCTGATQTNNFYATIPTTASNYVDIKVDVQTAGTYTIATPVVNGVSFSAAGTLAAGTNQNIRLLADGNAPIAAGSTFNYALTTPAPSASNCGFNLTVQAAPTPATYTFNCGTPTFFGTYQENVSTAGDSVRISVTSAAGGSYSITSTTANNVTFTGNGVLAASPNPQNVTLYASSTIADSAGLFTYTITGAGGSGTCTISQTYSAAPVSGGTITATVGGVPTTFNVSATVDTTSFFGQPMISVTGDKDLTGVENISFSVTSISGNLMQNVPYSVNSFTAVVNCDYTSSAPVDYNAINSGATQTNPFTVTFTLIANNHIKGKFMGRVTEVNGTATKDFILGDFDLTY